jgi:hypothetical protein
MRRVRFAAALLAGAMPFVTGCPAAVDPDPCLTALEEGWAELRSRSLADAETRFEEARSACRDDGEALTGLGWVRLHEGAAEEALDFFDRASEAAPEEVDPVAGRVLAYALLERRTDTRSEGLLVLSRSPEYVLGGDPSYAASDVRWVVARAALDLADYVTVAAQLDVLSPGHGLDPASAAFPERALTLLESLRAAV